MKIVGFVNRFRIWKETKPIKAAWFLPTKLDFQMWNADENSFASSCQTKKTIFRRDILWNVSQTVSVLGKLLENSYFIQK